MGNIMYIPESEQCPINKIVLTLDDNYDYQFSYFNGSYLYYTNQSKNWSIVSQIVISKKKKPKYIYFNNFIFNNDTYNHTFLNNYMGNGSKYLDDYLEIEKCQFTF